MKLLRIALISLLMVNLVACGGNKDGDSEVPPPKIPGEGGDPDGVALVFPENNSECTEGVVQNSTLSTITFRWETADNVDSYEVNLRNLETNTTSTTTSFTNEADITLERGKPYEWSVVSKKEGSDESPSSAKWRFYNQGPGVENYAPFPATVVFPTRGQTINTSNITLEWQGDDIDNDIVSFEVWFDTTSNPTTSLGTFNQNQVAVNVASGQTYFWRVITTDAVGNTSQSEIFDFQVE